MLSRQFARFSAWSLTLSTDICALMTKNRLDPTIVCIDDCKTTAGHVSRCRGSNGVSRLKWNCSRPSDCVCHMSESSASIAYFYVLTFFNICRRSVLVSDGDRCKLFYAAASVQAHGGSLLAKMFLLSITMMSLHSCASPAVDCSRSPFRPSPKRTKRLLVCWSGVLGNSHSRRHALCERYINLCHF